MDRDALSITVGPYLLEFGREPGTIVEAARGDGGADAEALEAALQEPEQRPSALAGEVEGASEATAKVERAAALAKGAAEGKVLDPAQLGLEVGALLDCLERLDRKKEHKKAIQMARSLATLLMLLKRWADLLRTLRTALRAGEHLGDLDAVAWAEHELGTLRLAAGDVAGADQSLRRAKELRKRIGDRRGLAATERNLGSLCERLRQMLQEGELMEEGRRAPTQRLALFAVLLALFFATAGFAVGSLTEDSSGPGQPTTVENASRSDGNPPVTDPDGDEPSTYETDSVPELGN